ncbi:hypothetical protein [Actinopolymorpha alba]|uniref:hypothetical protein n=1 Tax=Actinopolymorpha alba TaxID=533267 RepID=UPI000A2F670E|nr:hypothetical protein [Actinopolymorpha alba]
MPRQPRSQQRTGDGHGQAARSFRPDPDEYAAAQAVLSSRGEHMNTYLRACLRWLQHDPNAVLDTLAPHWPGPRSTGRPRRAAGKS